MIDRVLKNPKIIPIWNNEVVEIKGDDHIKKLVLKSTVSDGISYAITELEVTGLFVAIGHVPNSQFVKDLIETDKAGYIITNERKETNVEGIWAAGDIQDPHYRQAITAAGSGCMAALNVEKWLH